MDFGLRRPSLPDPSGAAQESFAVFLAYSTVDRRYAVQLQRDLERFRIPRSLVGTPGRFGPLPRRLGRVFLDRTDLSAAPDITAEIVAALAASEALVVLCSSSAAEPRRWIGREIIAYRQSRPGGRILAVILRDEPPGCFPPELYSDAGNDPAHPPAVPLAADMRPEGDGRRDALTKLVAGLVGVGFDVLRRQRARAERRRRLLFAGLGVAYAMTVSAALLGVGYAAIELLSSRNEAIADRAKSANDAGRTDLSLLLAATALPVRPSFLERAVPSAVAQAVRGLISTRVEAMIPSGGAILSAWDTRLQRMYFARYGGELFTVDATARSRVADWPVRLSGVTALALSADGKRLAVATEDGSLRVLDPQTGTDEAAAAPPAGAGRQGRSLAFSPASDRVAIGRQDGTAQIWSVLDHRWVSQAPRKADWPVTGVAFSDDGSRVLTASDPMLIEWEADSGRLVRERVSQGTVTDIAALDGGATWAVVYALSQTISLLSASTNRPDKIIQLPHPQVRARQSPDGRMLVTSSWRGASASLIDLKTGEVRTTLAHPEWVDDAIVLPDDGRVLTLARDGFVRIWRNPLTAAGTRHTAFTHGGGGVIARSADGRVFIGGGGPAIGELKASSEVVRSIASLPCDNPSSASSKCWMVGLHVIGNGQDLVYAVGDGRVGRLDASTGRAIWEAEIGVPVVGSALHPDRLHFVVVLGQGIVARIRLENGRSVDAVGGQVTPLNEISRGGLVFSASGELVAETNRDGLTVRRSADRNVVWRAPVYDRIAVSATWVPPGKFIAAGTAGNTVQLFSASGGPTTMILRGHSSWVVALHSSPSGRYLASVSSQEMIVWDLVAGELVKTVSGPVQGGFTDVSFAADGRSLALADSAGGLWSIPFEVPSGSLSREVCAALPDPGRQFTDAQMRELPFIRAVERAPCERPALLSFAQMRLVTRDILVGVWTWADSLRVPDGLQR